MIPEIVSGPLIMADALDSLPLLIEIHDLQTALQTPQHNILVVDAGSEERFKDKHIPGACLVRSTDTQAGPPIPGLAPNDEQLSRLMQSIGLTSDKHVVVYDDEGGGWAGRFIWLLDEIGHTHYSYLNGGLRAWEAANLPCESGLVVPTPSNITVHASGKHSINLEELRHAVEQHSLQIWDARSPAEYTGEKINAARGGHIPGALNYEWTEAMDQANQLRLKPFPQLLEELAAVGISPDQDTITHCQTHRRSGLTYLLGKLLGFKSIRAYAGSWGEWGNRQDTPIEK